MTNRLAVLRFMLTQAKYKVDDLKYFKDTNTLPIGNLDQQKLGKLIDLCRDIVDEMMLF